MPFDSRTHSPYSPHPSLWPTTLICALLALPAAAQTGPAAPAHAKASAPSLPYRSAFAGYQPFTDDKLQSWKDSNTAVTRSGRGHDHGQTAPLAPPASAPAADSHAGHHKH